MLNKIDIPGTTITLEIVDKNITITNKIEYDMQMHFRRVRASLLARHQGNTKNANRVSYEPWSQEGETPFGRTSEVL